MDIEQHLKNMKRGAYCLTDKLSLGLNNSKSRIVPNISPTSYKIPMYDWNGNEAASLKEKGKKYNHRKEENYEWNNKVNHTLIVFFHRGRSRHGVSGKLENSRVLYCIQ